MLIITNHMRKQRGREGVEKWEVYYCQFYVRDKHILMTGETCPGVRWERELEGDHHHHHHHHHPILSWWFMLWCGAALLSLSLSVFSRESGAGAALTLSHHLGQAASLPAGHTSVGHRTGPMEQCKHNYHFIFQHTRLLPSANSYFPLTLSPNILNIYISTVSLGQPSLSDIYFLNTQMKEQ